MPIDTSIDAVSLNYTYRRYPNRFEKLRADLLKAGYSDREILAAMAACSQLTNPLGDSPKRIPANRRKHARGHGAAVGATTQSAPESKLL